MLYSCGNRKYFCNYKYKEIVAPKQKQLKGKVKEQNELLVSLYKKRSLNQLSENDRKELIEREGILKDSKKGVEKMRA